MFYLFPFEMIEKGSRIVIYGAGRAGKEYAEQIMKTDYCDIVCLLDRNSSELTACGSHPIYPVYPPEEIKNIQDYDYVLVSVQSKKSSTAISEFLLDSGVPEEKILCIGNRRLEFDKTPNSDMIINRPASKGAADGYKEYAEYVEGLYYFLRNKNANRYFVEITERPYKPEEGDTKLIAWYLPQFYQMEVNDKYHGLGFTEWSNTTRMTPLFTGHYQPRLPYDMGFYKLTELETLKRQVQLAKMYGIYGFCFHYYWFSGVRTMEKPLELFLEHKELDIRFCMHWCTENWTALWDGEDNAVIFEQKLEDDDDERFMRDILPYMKDERYIKIDGKPVLMIYRVNMFEQKRFAALIDNFRKYAKEAGLPDIYVMLTTRDKFEGELAAWRIDALVELPNINVAKNGSKHQIKGYVNQYFYAKNNVIDVEPFIDQDCPLFGYEDKNVYRSALVSFDATPRKANSRNCWLTVNSTPQNYKKWLKSIIRKTKAKRTREENYAFIFAWNEWAESAYLEPDMLYGYAYLQATKEALEETRPIRDNIIVERLRERKEQGVTQFSFFVHCIESIGDIVACEPIARHLKGLEPDSKVIWLINKNATEVVKWNPYIDEIIEVGCLAESVSLINEKQNEPSNIIIDCHYDGRICASTRMIHRNPNNPQVNEATYFDYGPLLVNFCYSAGLGGLTEAPVFYQATEIKALPELPEKYVVFHCQSAERIKDWDAVKWNRLAERIMALGLCVVEIGLDAVIKEKNKNYYDYTDINSIQVAAEIIKRSACFVGIDSLFAHVANCFNTYGILLFGKYKNFNRPLVYTGNYAKGLNSTIIYARDNLPAKDISEDDVFGEFKRAAAKGFR
jgi:ADP-heptose:LPS heptosyltransferase